MMQRNHGTSTKLLDYTVFFEPLDEGGYMVVIPALPGVITWGTTLVEARRMARDAIKCHCEGLLKDGEPLPSQRLTRRKPVRETVRVALSYA